MGVPNLHQGAIRPLDAPSGEIFLPKASTSQQLIVFLISTFQLQQLPRFQGSPKFTLGGTVPPVRPLAEFFFAPQASTLLCLMAFLISTFQLLYVPRYYGGPKFTLGGHTPLGRPQRRNIFTQSEYFTISNCIYNFNILALVVTEILGGSQIYFRGPCAPPYATSGNFFVPQASTLLCLMAFLISTFQLFYFPRYQGGPKFTLGGPMPPARPLADKFLYPKRVLYNI